MHCPDPRPPSPARLRRRSVLTGALALALLLLGAAVPAGAASGSTEAQRERFLAAWKAIHEGRPAEARAALPALSDYVLAPYLAYEDLWRNLSRRDRSTIEAFLVAERGTLIAERLRTTWLRQLARRGDWDTFRAVYTPQDSAELECQFLTASVRAGQGQAVLTQIRDRWLTGKSVPDACDPAFAFLYQSPLMNDELVWERIKLAMAAGRPGLARFLSGKLQNPADVALVDQWRDLHAGTGRFRADSIRRKDALGRHIAAALLERRARQNLTAAIDLYRDLSERMPFTAEERSHMVRDLALRAFRADHPAELDLLDAIAPAQVDDAVETARLKAALDHRDWGAILRWSEQPASNASQDLAFRYWRGRALEETGNPEAGAALFRELAKERDYYGFLAADRVGLPYRFVDIPVAPTAAERAAVAARPGVARMLELDAVGLKREARREWYHEITRMDRRTLEVAAQILFETGEHHRAILNLGRARSYDDLSLRFPLLHEATVREYAQRRGLPASEIYSIIRAESAFLPTARSGAGARGLMQLMPATAKETARRIDLRYRSDSQLEDPRINIMLGSAYLADMLKDHGGNFILAAAAYNAGPHRVKRWRSDLSCMPADIWVELIPFAETRSYVRRTLFYSVIYEWRMELPIRRIGERIAPVSSPRGAASTC